MAFPQAVDDDLGETQLMSILVHKEARAMSERFGDFLPDPGSFKGLGIIEMQMARDFVRSVGKHAGQAPSIFVELFHEMFESSGSGFASSLDDNF